LKSVQWQDLSIEIKGKRAYSSLPQFDRKSAIEAHSSIVTFVEAFKGNSTAIFSREEGKQNLFAAVLKVFVTISLSTAKKNEKRLCLNCVSLSAPNGLCRFTSCSHVHLQDAKVDAELG